MAFKQDAFGQWYNTETNEHVSSIMAEEFNRAFQGAQSSTEDTSSTKEKAKKNKTSTINITSNLFAVANTISDSVYPMKEKVEVLESRVNKLETDFVSKKKIKIQAKNTKIILKKRKIK